MKQILCIAIGLRRLIVMIFITACLIINTIPSFAFEMDGFRSHMELKDALRVARQFDPDAKIFRSSHSPYQREIETLEFVAGQPFMRRNLYFCNGHLAYLVRSYPINMHVLTGAMQAMLHDGGQTKINTYTEQKEVGILNRVIFSQITSSEEKEITIQNLILNTEELKMRSRETNTGAFVIESYKSKSDMQLCTK